MTCEAGKTGRDAASVASRPGSCEAAASDFLSRLTGLHPRCLVGAELEAGLRLFARFAYEQRIVGAIQDHAAFDGILAEHALALEEARGMLSEALTDPSLNLTTYEAVSNARRLIDQEIKHVRSLGSVAQHQEEKDAHED